MAAESPDRDGSWILRFFAMTEGVLIPRMSAKRWQELKSYPLRPDDVIISSYPRSGTTWTQHVVRLLRNGGNDDGINLDDAVPSLDSLGTEKGNLFNLNPNATEELASPRSMKVHLPYHMMPGGIPHAMPIRYIYIARNPKDACVSHWYFLRSQVSKFFEIDNSTYAWDTFCADFMKANASGKLYGGWLNHVLEWWEHRREPNILFIKYEDAIKEPHKTVQTISEFLGTNKELVETVVDQSSFTNMWNNPTVNNRRKEGARCEVAYLRKGIIGDCISQLSRMLYLRRRLGGH